MLIYNNYTVFFILLLNVFNWLLLDFCNLHVESLILFLIKLISNSKVTSVINLWNNRCTLYL